MVELKEEKLKSGVGDKDTTVVTKVVQAGKRKFGKKVAKKGAAPRDLERQPRKLGASEQSTRNHARSKLRPKTVLHLR